MYGWRQWSNMFPVVTKEDHLKPESRLFQLLSLLPVLLLVLAGPAAGQEYRAKVQGIVTDPSQAAIVGAKVTLRNVNTGVEDSKETDTTGRFIFDFVQPGSYTVAVEAPGFQRFLQEGVAVLTRGDVTVNAQMTPYDSS